MKKYLYILLGSIILVQACSKENSLGLNAETKEDNVNSSVGVHPNAKVYTQSLVSASDGWLMEYEGHKFWFTFEENGIVSCDSDFTEMPLDAIFSITSSGDDAVLSIIGGGHFRYLPEGKRTPQFLIKSLTNDAIELALLETSELSVVTKKASLADVAVFKTKLFFVELSSSNAMSGVMRKDGDFLMHYTINRDVNKVDFTYITSIEAKHYTRVFVQGDMNISWETEVQVGVTDVQWTGIKYNSDTFKIEPIYTSSSNTQITLDGNAHIMTRYLASGQEYMIADTDQGGKGLFQWASGALETEIDKFQLSGLRVLEVNFGRSERSFVACLRDPLAGYIFYDATPQGSGLDAVNYNLDRVTWTNLGTVAPYRGAEHIETTTLGLTATLAAYFDSNGLYVVPIDLPTGTTKDKHWFLISATNGGWFRLKAKK